ncbi:hypothetical protein BPOR_1169g00030 [Botrytis porri]|uniref:Uncharacterized protein n=1 Tax=Botrytis porri TaxID=87229 RepID=A0A4Z1KIV2_9HELO|nr:hypothetical protein BPOR_1169g00030 [Botrytis porri]
MPADGDVSSSFLAIFDSPPDKEEGSNSSSDELPFPNTHSMVLNLPVTTAEIDRIGTRHPQKIKTNRDLRA